MPELSCYNIPAQYCTSRLSEHGRRIVQYQGDDYVIVGLYFARHYGGNANRTPIYILRPIRGYGQMHSRAIPHQPSKEAESAGRTIDHGHRSQVSWARQASKGQ